MPSILDLVNPRLLGTYKGIVFYADEAVKDGEGWVISERCSVVSPNDGAKLEPELKPCPTLGDIIEQHQLSVMRGARGGLLSTEFD